jgi:DNA invertase Pin-like site-specific DNA recombinase
MKPKRIVLYDRVSTKDKGQDVENQLAQLRDFCRKQDWTIIHEYVDHVSGKASDNRPHFKAMLAAASRRDSTWCCSGAWTGSAGKASCPR